MIEKLKDTTEIVINFMLIVVLGLAIMAELALPGTGIIAQAVMEYTGFWDLPTEQQEEVWDYYKRFGNWTEAVL